MFSESPTCPYWPLGKFGTGRRDGGGTVSASHQMPATLPENRGIAVAVLQGPLEYKGGKSPPSLAYLCYGQLRELSPWGNVFPDDQELRQTDLRPRPAAPAVAAPDGALSIVRTNPSFRPDACVGKVSNHQT